MAKPPKKTNKPVADYATMLETARSRVKERTGRETLSEETDKAIQALAVTLSNPRFVVSGDWNTPSHKMQRERTNNLTMRLTEDGLALEDATKIALDVTEKCINQIPQSGNKSMRKR